MTAIGVGIFMISPAPIWYVICWIFARRQNLHPISGRYAQISLLGGIGLATLLIAEGLALLIDELPCYFRQLSYQWLAPSCFFVLALRMVILLAQFEITKHLFNNHGAVPNATMTGTAGGGTTVRPITSHAHGGHVLPMNAPLPFFVRHRRIIRPEWNRRAVVIGSFCFLLMWTLYCVILNPSHAFTQSCDGMTGWWIDLTVLFPFVYVCTLLAVCILAGVRLGRYDQDGFGIKTELKLFVAGVGGLTLLVVVMTMVNPPWIRDFTNVVVCLGNAAIFLPTILYPIYLSYSFAKQQQRYAAEMQRMTKLTEWLALPNGFDIFLQFCMMEFCSESLYFVRQSSEFKDQVNESATILARLKANNSPMALNTGAYQLDQHVNQAIAILETYIDPRSPYELNLSAEVRRKARSLVTAIEAHLTGTTVADTTTLQSVTSPVAPIRALESIDMKGSSMDAALPTSPSPPPLTKSASKYQVLSPVSPVPPDGLVFTDEALQAGGEVAKHHQLLLKLATVFDEASAACIHLLQGNSFNRFRASALFRDFVSELEKGNTAKVAMKKAGSRLRLSVVSKGGHSPHTHDDAGSIVSVNHRHGTLFSAGGGHNLGGGMDGLHSIRGNGSLLIGAPAVPATSSGSNVGVMAQVNALVGQLPPPSLPPIPLTTSLSPTGALSKRMSGAFSVPPTTASASTSPTAARAATVTPLVSNGYGSGIGILTSAASTSSTTTIAATTVTSTPSPPPIVGGTSTPTTLGPVNTPTPPPITPLIKPSISSNTVDRSTATPQPATRPGLSKTKSRPLAPAVPGAVDDSP